MYPGLYNTTYTDTDSRLVWMFMLHLALIVSDLKLTWMFAWNQEQHVELTVYLMLWLSAVARVHLYPLQEKHQLLEQCHLHHLQVSYSCQEIGKTSGPNMPRGKIWELSNILGYFDWCPSWILLYTWYTVEPPDKGHLGKNASVLCREVILILEVTFVLSLKCALMYCTPFVTGQVAMILRSDPVPS